MYGDGGHFFGGVSLPHFQLCPLIPAALRWPSLPLESRAEPVLGGPTGQPRGVVRVGDGARDIHLEMAWRFGGNCLEMAHSTILMKFRVFSEWLTLW